MKLWVTSLNRSPQAQLRLFCLPYAGGGARIFRPWAADLPPGIEVCPIQIPGREDRLSERPYTRLAPLVRAVAEHISPYLNIPFAFFGHSMGALVSFELARYLRREQELAPAHLIVSARSATQTPGARAPIHRLREAPFIKELRRLNGTPEEILQNAELMHLMLPVLRADFAVCETYVYSADRPLDCPISAFGGVEDVEVSRAGLQAWQKQTSGPFKVRLFPGGHFFLHTARALLMRAITEDLTQHLKPTG